MSLTTAAGLAIAHEIGQATHGITEYGANQQRRHNSRNIRRHGKGDATTNKGTGNKVKFTEAGLQAHALVAMPVKIQPNTGETKKLLPLMISQAQNTPDVLVHQA